MREDNNNNKHVFLIELAVFAIACFFIFYEHRMNAQNTTAYALNYSYGFIPRGLIGTIISVIDRHIDIDLYTYQSALMISMAATMILFILLFAFYDMLLRRCRERDMPLMMGTILLLSVFIFPEFWTWNNFGRTDEYLMIITIICLILIVIERFEWLILPAVVLACLVHVGFVFTNVAIILVALFYKALTNQQKKIYYWSLCLGVFFAVSIIFLYLEIFRKPLDMNDYNMIVDLAKRISEDGKSISDSLLDSEILCLNVYEDEWIWRKRNIVETPLFLLFFMPYIVVAIRFFARLVKNAKKTREKIKYLAVSLGMITIIPSLVLKVDYGRWIFCIIFYYISIIAVMVSLGDVYVIDELSRTVTKIKEKMLFWPIAFLYPFLFMPFRDVYISDITTNIMNYIMGW